MSKYNYDWKELLKEQQASGMTMKSFCKERNLPYHAFKNHKYAILEKEASTTLFLPVKAESPQRVQLILNGNQISFDANLDDELISRIFKALRV